MLWSCGQKADESVSAIKNGSHKEYTIHMTKVKDTLSPKLSDFVKDFEFVPLETKEECMLNRGVYYVTKEFILVQKSRYGILQFDRSGKFIRTLVRYGKGPREYTNIALTVDESKQILYLTDRSKINYFLSYDLRSGKYLGDLKKAIPCTSRDIYFTDGEQIIVTPFGRPDNNDHFLYCFKQSLDGELIDSVLAPPNWYNTSGRASMYIFDNNIRYFDKMEDQIYSLREAEMSPYIKFDWAGSNPADVNTLGYCSMGMNYETSSFILLQKNKIVKVANRVTLAEPYYYIFNKNSEKVFHQGSIFFDPVHDSFHDLGFKSLSIQPNGIVSFVYQAVDLIDQAERAFDDDEFSGKYRNQLQDVISKISEEDNPIVIIGRLK